LQERAGRRLGRVVSVTAAATHVAVEVVEQWSCGEVARTLRFGTCDGRIMSCTVVEHDAAAVDAELSRP
jgi:hypothetical protein